jgi:SAM-dependent MidA family methyltransferase
VSPFENHLRSLIALEGPIPVERYMDLCVRHYYATRDPLGADGDFTTAPEISQMFGELVGLWLLEVWHAMGRPSPCLLVELGPGRGTLMADILRSSRVLPDFRAAISIHLVETSPVLRRRQQQALAGTEVSISWHDRLDDVPLGPMLLVANEFFDALPVRQFMATERGWCEQLVGVEENQLIFGLKPEPEQSLGNPIRLRHVLEWPAAGVDVMKALAARIARSTGAALIIDYGYWGPGFGSTLQALKRHAFVDPLEQPGEADLTAHVDFHRLAQSATTEDVRLHGLVTQDDFLQALGIEARAAALKQRASEKQASDIDAALTRLTARGPKAMGELFKVLALTHQGLEAVPGLPLLSSSLQE